MYDQFFISTKLIGRKPVFYSPEMIPFYPNPLPHFRQGKVLLK
jgi:hypothetical protein